MIQIEGIWWPDDVGDKWKHALMHVKSVEWAIARCKKFRTAVQAGGNIGLWPRRLAQSFMDVFTFEPDDVSRACLVRNAPANVDIAAKALGAEHATCSIKHRGLGSHNLIAGDACVVVPLDDMALQRVDFIQLDVEGYEWHALKGAEATIARCRPILQLELRDSPLVRHGSSVADVRGWLSERGYRQVSAQQGSDFVFEAR